MSEFLGSDYIFNTLVNDAPLVALLGTWTDSSSVSHPSVHNGRMVPEIDASTETVNFYRTGSFVGGNEYFQVDYSLDCRAKSEYNSLAIALTAVVALNRVYGSFGSMDYFGVCDILPTIPPADDADVYNTPVTFRLKRR
jgi:hypothetical protein